MCLTCLVNWQVFFIIINHFTNLLLRLCVQPPPLGRFIFNPTAMSSHSMHLTHYGNGSGSSRCKHSRVGTAGNRAWDATRLEPQVCFFCLFSFYCAANAAGIRDWISILYSAAWSKILKRFLSTPKIHSMTFCACACWRLNNSYLFWGLAYLLSISF